MIKNLLLVGIGGFIGSTLRYLIAIGIEKRLQGSFPIATFTVNIIGSLFLGLLIGYFAKGSLSDSYRLLLAVGVCGSFTTFSTFAMENINLINKGELLVTFSYICLSLILGLAAALAGQIVSSKF